MNIKYLYTTILALLVYINSAFAQDISSKDLSVLINEYNRFSIENTGDVYWNDVKVLFTMEYFGSLPNSDMFFLTNSIMVLRTKFYTISFDSEYENIFFYYLMDEEILKIVFIDTRIDVTKHLDIAMSQVNKNKGILSVDYIEKSITYNIRKNKILFGNFYFFLDWL